MFGLSIVKTADLNNLKVRVADLETDVDSALDKSALLLRKYDSLADQVQRNDKAVRVQLDALAKPKVCPLLTAVPKHVADPVGAWESKRSVLQERINYAQYDLKQSHSDHQFVLGSFASAAVVEKTVRDVQQAQQYVTDLTQELFEHYMVKPKPVVVDKPRFVRNKRQVVSVYLKVNISLS